LKDKYIVIGVAQDNQFNELCKVLKLNLSDKFKENKDRVANKEELQTLIERVLDSWDVQDLI
jgi:crotonobetainyl-CoA:carnitine CoA-transferase CaiB-like acyl-CoA transferase